MLRTFGDSALAAFNSTQNGLKLDGVTGVAVASIIASVYQQNPNASVADVFQAIANAGFDPIGSSTNPGYGQRTSQAINSYQGVLDCLRANGYL
jgi:hypothetical protein